MNLYEAQDFFKKMYPDKQISYDFDDSCIRQIECIYTDGKLHSHNHVEYQKVRVTVEGMSPMYVPIAPHRMIGSAAYVKGKIPRDDVHIHPDELKTLQGLINENDDRQHQKLAEMIEITGLTADQIKARL